MTGDEVIDEFIKKFPEFTESIKKEFEWWNGENPGAHNFFSEVLNPFLVDSALITLENPKLIDRIFEFFEEMAISEDKYIKEVLSDTILERLGDDRFILDKARKFMRKNTLIMSHNVEKGWGRE